MKITVKGKDVSHFAICPKNQDLVLLTNRDEHTQDNPPSRTSKPVSNRPGYDALWLWFSISRAGWVTLPRVLIHEMPDDWQGKMATLLREYESTFTEWPEGLGSRVQLTDNGSLTSYYNWLHDYRHPAKGKIETLKAKAK